MNVAVLAAMRIVFLVGAFVYYFAASEPELARLDLSHGPASIGWPCVDCDGWLDGLATLTAELTGNDPSEFGDEVLMSGDFDGPWLALVPHQVCHALAGVTDDRLNAYASSGRLRAEETTRVVCLRDLARQAVADGRDAYCWSSL